MGLVNLVVANAIYRPGNVPHCQSAACCIKFYSYSLILAVSLPILHLTILAPYWNFSAGEYHTPINHSCHLPLDCDSGFVLHFVCIGDLVLSSLLIFCSYAMSL